MQRGFVVIGMVSWFGCVSPREDWAETSVQEAALATTPCPDFWMTDYWPWLSDTRYELVVQDGGWGPTWGWSAPVQTRKFYKDPVWSQWDFDEYDSLHGNAWQDTWAMKPDFGIGGVGEIYDSLPSGGYPFSYGYPIWWGDGKGAGRSLDDSTGVTVEHEWRRTDGARGRQAVQLKSCYTGWQVGTTTLVNPVIEIAITQSQCQPSSADCTQRDWWINAVYYQGKDNSGYGLGFVGTDFYGSCSAGSSCDGWTHWQDSHRAYAFCYRADGALTCP